MPRFAANISMLFPELPFLERFPAAAKGGFKGVEYVGPYDHPAEQIAERLGTIGYEVVCAIGARVPRRVLGERA